MDLADLCWGWTIRASPAISIAPMPSLALRRPTRASSPTLAEGPARPGRRSRKRSSYEALDDLIGQLISSRGLIHAGDTVDPARAKFTAMCGTASPRFIDPSVVFVSSSTG
jgi:hypothetical protein